MSEDNSQLTTHNSPSTIRVLAIETSCDETAAAIVEGTGEQPLRVLSNVVASQAAMHAEFGGVFPDLAAREHTKRVLPVIGLALHEAGLLDNPDATGAPVQQALQQIDAITPTVGPGLIGPLLIGANAAAQLAQLADKPVVPVNHWEGHLYSVFLAPPETQVMRNEQGVMSNPANSSLITHHSSLPQFPILSLTVSGGHSSLILMRHHFEYEVLGSTIDDAAGEAFDKCARLLGLSYPGGPLLSQAATEARKQSMRDETSHYSSPITHHPLLKLPRPMLNSGDLRFSFSGLKTAVRYAIDRGDIRTSDEKAGMSNESHHPSLSRNEAAREIEDAIVDVLLGKLARAVEQTHPATVAIVGGVSANAELRRRAAEQFANHSLFIPHPLYTTDNAAMIGAIGLFRFLKKQGITTWQNLTANASLRLS